ncbi:MAG: acyl-CoA/acyl-ACP dehydrogenase [Alphaproteobacteria bacterium]|nr:acyl-CoA/acyl-ACP dehydrogenase [Alphaproteobacteria bacterium]
MEAAEDQSESVRMIRDSAAGIAPRTGDLRRIRALRFTDPGFDRGVWRQMCEMGWPGLRLPEEKGGSGLGMVEFCALCEELGAGLVPEPLIQVAMAANLLGSQERAPLLAGDHVVIPAWQERASTFDATATTRFVDGKVTGSKMFVSMAAGADAFLVTTADGLALIGHDAPGVSLAIERTQDGGNFGLLRLEGAPAEPVPGEMSEALEEAALATAAYMLGVMDRGFAITLDYLKTRQQFGRVIGSFQALQHRAADLKIQLALTRASVESAASVLDADVAPAARKAAVSRAKARASDAGMIVTRQCIQLHGGIGYTDEYDVGLFLRKAMVLANLYGSAALHRARFAEVSPEQDDD